MVFCFVFLICFDGEVINVLLFEDSAAMKWTYLSLFGVTAISCFSYYMTLLLILLVVNMPFYFFG